MQCHDKWMQVFHIKTSMLQWTTIAFRQLETDFNLTTAASEGKHLAVRHHHPATDPHTPWLYLRVDSLDVGVQIALLGEGCRAEHAEVRLLPGVFHHVGLQHHLLVEGLAAVGALEGSLPFEREREMEREIKRETERKKLEGRQQRETTICYSEFDDSAHSIPQRCTEKIMNLNITLHTVLLLT